MVTKRTKKLIVVILVAVIIAVLVLTICTTTDNEPVPTVMERLEPIPLLPETKSTETTEETTWVLSREILLDTAYELYGVSEEWTMWLIGTTHNEGYQSDRYLEFAWACEIVNEYKYWSVYDLDCIWGDYYSIGNAFNGYYSADYTTLEMVWYALTETDTRICEVDGMITYPPDNYYLIYDSPIYNCQVWGN